MIGDKIGNHTVIESISIGNAKFVVGENLNNPATPYGTWQANIKNDPSNYFWGHYMATKEDAIADYGERITQEANYQKSFRLKSQEEKPKDKEVER